MKIDWIDLYLMWPEKLHARAKKAMSFDGLERTPRVVARWFAGLAVLVAVPPVFVVWALSIMAVGLGVIVVWLALLPFIGPAWAYRKFMEDDF